MRLGCLLLFAACGCGSEPGGGLPDAAPLVPFTTRVSSDSDPATMRVNLTLWNWDRQLAVGEDGTVHAVWDQLATADVNPPADRPDPVDTTQLPAGQIVYARSSDRGRTWSQPQPLSAVAAGTDSGSVATAGSFVYAIYRAVDQGRLRVFFRASADGGVTWSTAIAISDNPAGVSASPPALAAWGSGDSPSVFVVWADGRPQLVAGQTKTVKEIYLVRSPDRGATWSGAGSVSVPDGFSSWTPAVAVWSDAVHVAWTDERDDLSECTLPGGVCREEEYYRLSGDEGMTWGAETRLTFDPPGQPRASWAPSMAVWENSVHIAYLDQRSGFFQNYYRRSRDGGRSFDPEVMLAADPQFQNAARPTIAARDGIVHLAWFGFSDFDADVYYSRSLDDGGTWSPFLDLTSDGAGAARIPHVAVGPDGSAHLIWYDTRNSDASGAKVEIYYSHPEG